MKTTFVRGAARHLVMTCILTLPLVTEHVRAAEPAPAKVSDAKNPAAAAPTSPTPAPSTLSPKAAAALPYVSLEGPYDPPASPVGNKGSLREMSVAALTAKTLGEAREKWEAFLKTHKPGDGPAEGYGDGTHVRAVRRAQYELVRVYYLLGETTLADKLLLEMKQEDEVLRDYVPGK